MLNRIIGAVAGSWRASAFAQPAGQPAVAGRAAPYSWRRDPMQGEPLGIATLALLAETGG